MDCHSNTVKKSLYCNIWLEAVTVRGIPFIRAHISLNRPQKKKTKEICTLGWKRWCSRHLSALHDHTRGLSHDQHSNTATRRETKHVRVALLTPWKCAAIFSPAPRLLAWLWSACLGWMSEGARLQGGLGQTAPDRASKNLWLKSKHEFLNSSLI